LHAWSEERPAHSEECCHASRGQRKFLCWWSEWRPTQKRKGPRHITGAQLKTALEGSCAGCFRRFLRIPGDGSNRFRFAAVEPCSQSERLHSGRALGSGEEPGKLKPVFTEPDLAPTGDVRMIGSRRFELFFFGIWILDPYGQASNRSPSSQKGCHCCRSRRSPLRRSWIRRYISCRAKRCARP
jgi:hypothetical protein